MTIASRELVTTNKPSQEAGSGQAQTTMMRRYSLYNILVEMLEQSIKELEALNLIAYEIMPCMRLAATYAVSSLV